MKSGQADQVRVVDLTRKIKRLLDQESLVGAVILLRSVRSVVAHKVMEQLSPVDREKIYDASFAWGEEGVVATPRVVQLERSAPVTEDKTQEIIVFFPDQLVSALTTAALITSLILILTIFSPAKLDVKADILNTSVGVKPPWYFLFLYSFFNLVPSILGILVPIIGGLLLTLLPFLDRNPEVRISKRKFAIISCIVLLLVLVLLSILGAYYG